MMTPKELLKSLIRQHESEYLDFKKEVHENKADLLHDILCMANSRHAGDKYIIFGVTDKRKTVGIVDQDDQESETNAILKKQEHLTKFLKDSAKLNRSLWNDVTINWIEFNKKILGLLTIKNRPDKPFFLTADFHSKENKTSPRTVRAGVVYTRHQDQNTSINSTARDDEIELMWRQRFGLDLIPLERFRLYLDDIERWKKTTSEEHNNIYYYESFPEFKVIEEDPLELSFPLAESEKWVPEIWTSSKLRILKTMYNLIYSELRFDEPIQLWWGYNGREPLPVPKPNPTNWANGEPISYEWILSKRGLSYKVARIVARVGKINLDEILSRTPIQFID